MTIEARVGAIGSTIQTVVLEDDATIQQAITTAGLDASGFDIRVDGDSVTLGDDAEDGMTILLCKQVKGNVNA